MEHILRTDSRRKGTGPKFAGTDSATAQCDPAVTEPAAAETAIQGSAGNILNATTAEVPAVYEWPDSAATPAARVRDSTLKEIRQLLTDSLPDDIRETLSMDVGFHATPKGVEGAAAWTALKTILRERCRRLAEIAATYVEPEQRFRVAEAELELWRSDILRGSTASIDFHMCLILLDRGGIGTDASRNILEDKLHEAMEDAKVELALAFAPPIDGPLHPEGRMPMFDDPIYGSDDEHMALAKTAARYVDDLRRMRRARGGSEAELRSQFPTLAIWNGIDTSRSLSQGDRDKLFPMSLAVYRQPELWAFVGGILGVSGGTLYDYYKMLRDRTGKKRKRRAKNCSVAAQSQVLLTTPNSLLTPS